MAEPGPVGSDLAASVSPARVIRATAVLASPVALVLLALADYANDRRECWPSVQHLARRCRLSVRQVQRVLNKLARCGELDIYNSLGAHFTNRYRIAVMRGHPWDEVEKPAL